MALPLGIDGRAYEKAPFDFFFCLEEADVGNLRLVVERESLTFPAVIDGDVVAVDGFDATTPFLPHVFRPNSFFTDFPLKANS